MTLRASTPLLAALLAAGVTATVLAQQPQQPQNQTARTMKVGVVDIGVLFRDYKRKDQLEQAVNNERERIKKELEEEAEAVRRLRKQLDAGTFVINSEPWLQLRDEIKQAQFILELKTERKQQVLKKRVEELTLQILTELETTIRTYGERHGFDLILKSDRQSDQANPAQGELTAEFQERIFRAQISDVLYFNDQVEITENVKSLLNSDANMKKMDQLAREREQRRQAAPAQPPANGGGQAPANGGGQGQPPGAPPSAPPGANRGG